MLEITGKRIRALREQQGLTRQQLADKTGISLRFLAEVEKGDANVSLLRLSEIAQALGVSLVSLVAGCGPIRDEAEVLVTLPPALRIRALRAGRPPEKLVLVGLRGAGKSTVGGLLAHQLSVPFVEVDQEIEQTAGLSLGEIFELHGAARYRELERAVLGKLVARPGGAVLAAGGSVVTVPDTWAWLRQETRTIWLKASAESHLMRVEQQEDLRPMRGFTDALGDIRRILEQRGPLYAQAELCIETSLQAAEQVAGILSLQLA
jgi:XRE family aerobic/anaerobic benzoate catabolism transcriptional regulator